ncbi:MAG: helix-turn-helix domain-containing protein [Acidimicrobiales bacterium]
MNGWELRAARRQAGLTLRDVARAAGTSESNVSAYERGSKRPSAATSERLHAALAVGRTSPIHANTLLTVPAAAASLRFGLRRSWATVDLLRIVRELVSNAAWVKTDADVAAFFARPSTTGDERWDAMLAGVVENLSLKTGRPVPEWTAGHALHQLWFVGSVAALDAYALAHTPPSLRVRGVVVDEESLESV